MCKENNEQEKVYIFSSLISSNGNKKAGSILDILIQFYHFCREIMEVRTHQRIEPHEKDNGSLVRTTWCEKDKYKLNFKIELYDSFCLK